MDRRPVVDADDSGADCFRRPRRRGQDRDHARRRGIAGEEAGRVDRAALATILMAVRASA
jgi:hypothetical protein